VLADEITGSKQVNDNLRNFISALNAAAVLTESSCGTIAIDLSNCAPLPDYDAWLDLVELHLHVAEIVIDVEGFPESGEVRSRGISRLPSARQQTDNACCDRAH